MESFLWKHCLLQAHVWHPLYLLVFLPLKQELHNYWDHLQLEKWDLAHHV